MKTEEIIMKWKNPEHRLNKVDHPSGTSFNELDIKEMSSICGGSDEVQPQTTPTCLLIGGIVSAVVSAPVSYTITRTLCK